jgi:hypothetical protein
MYSVVSSMLMRRLFSRVGEDVVGDKIQADNYVCAALYFKAGLQQYRTPMSDQLTKVIEGALEQVKQEAEILEHMGWQKQIMSELPSGKVRIVMVRNQSE